MNETQNSKTALIKTLAIIGFFATIALLVWVGIQGLRVVPGAFSSLASIAESVQNYGHLNELSIATEKSVVVSGESFKLTWTDLKQNGTYVFTYTCTEGVSLQVRGTEGALVTVPCTDALSLPSDATGLFISISSEKERFTDVPFAVAFKKENGDTVTKSDARVTVVNATIPLIAEAPTPIATTTEEVPVVVTPKPVVKPTVPVTKPTTPVPPKTNTVVTYYPQSNPNGFTDLKMTYLGVGEMNGNTFSPVTKFDRSERNGLKFEVKNIGTKTSGTWTFKTTLPGGVVYESPVQVALKPNERVEFTLGFNIDDEDEKANEVTVKSTVYTKGDTNSKNDSFSWVVGVKN